MELEEKLDAIGKAVKKRRETQRIMQSRSIITYLILTFALLSACAPRKSEQPVSRIGDSDSTYMARGDKLVAITFDTLRNTLTSAIGEHGFVYAISLCNEKANTLTTLYQEEKVLIRRASDRFRNPNNQPDSLESAMIEWYRSHSPSATIVRKDGEVHYIKPILMQGMCLNCHGSTTDIKPETQAAIQEKYPADKATGYKTGDLRGLWHIVFLDTRAHR